MGATKKKLLYLVHRIPYPPNKGDKIRSFNILKFLSGRYEIHLGTFIDDEHDWRYVKELDQYCCNVFVAPLKSARAKLRSLPALLGHGPMSVAYYSDASMRAWVEMQCSQHRFDAVLVFSSAMAQYVAGEAWSNGRRVIDFVDVDSDKWLQYAQKKTWPMSWLYRREGRTLLEFDRRIAEEFDASFFVSAQEAELFVSLSGIAASKVGHADNGVDIDYFSPAIDYPNPYAENEEVIVFTGAMDYWANVDAVNWFARQVMPEVLKVHTNACFYIVGSRPARQVLELQNLPGIKVTGSVKEVRPYLAHARLAVAPMRIARGVQNKVLEAMAMAKAVVVSPQGFDGIIADVNNDLMVADSADAFVGTVTGLLKDGERARQLGQLARICVEQNYAWEKSLQKLIPMLEQ